VCVPYIQEWILSLDLGQTNIFQIMLIQVHVQVQVQILAAAQNYHDDHDDDNYTIGNVVSFIVVHHGSGLDANQRHE
jgi:hypothetical protein